MTATSDNLQFASAIAEEDDTRKALATVIDQIAPRLDRKVDLAIIFAGADHRQSFKLIHEAVTTELAAKTIIAVSAPLDSFRRASG